ncbi:hypothetical protein NKG94_23435 [Micromonospora sp. M12]
MDDRPGYLSVLTASLALRGSTSSPCRCSPPSRARSTTSWSTRRTRWTRPG